MSGCKDKISGNVTGTAKKCQAIMETKQKPIGYKLRGMRTTKGTDFSLMEEANLKG